MNFQKTKILDSYLINLDKIADDRGFFSRLFCADEFKNKNISFNFPQVNTSQTKHKGSIRGFHYQRDNSSESKLVKCIKGSIYDIVVDIRPNSKTYMKWEGFELNDINRSMLLIPKGCAHGFQSLEDNIELIYFVDEKYNPDLESGIRWNDEAFKFNWPLTPTGVSTKDQNWPDYKI